MVGWDSDFSYDYFKKILKVAKTRFELHKLSEVPNVIGKEIASKIVFRHDVDVSLKRALTMARIEKTLGISSTYMVMTESKLYDISDNSSRQILREILDLNHEIALHFVPPKQQIDFSVSRIEDSCREIQKVISSNVLSISFHRPPDYSLGGSLMIGGRVNAYAKELMEWYRSDSGGRWIGGEPLPQLSSLRVPLLQLLIHPIWWGEKHLSREERLRDFVAEETEGKSVAEASKLRENIISTIDVKF